MSHNVNRMLEANSKGLSVFALTGMLERLGVQNAVYVHQTDVWDYVDRWMDKWT